MQQRTVFISLLIILLITTCYSQSATISEETISVDTYYFSDPNPVPILADNPKIYPYFKFEGYEHQPTKKDWKIVTLENDYVKLWVLPEMGGKVWGAIEKGTGEEFLYKNEVMKFRNLSMRGPWTSGGLEFNFGIIGHSPDTATPVDYKITKNKDGSVSCTVGTMDVAARNHWWVKITLEPDKAYFETQASWYNGTPLNQAYYNWMTAAAAVSDDLEFIYPGNQYLKHSGEAKPWPQGENGKNVALYRNNDFGPAKSKHVVGEYNDIFGGYYHNKDFGFGHWGLYEEIPGQKLWLWSLSRFGGIWEDLLTDTDGQYMEFQAGRLFNQFSPDAHPNPITQANFDPYSMDKWRELWFPYKEIGGMVAASEYGVLNVKEENGEMYVGLNALQKLNHDIRIVVNGKVVFTNKLKLRPMEVFSRSIAAKTSDKVEVFVDNADLYYVNDPDRLLIKRPFQSDEKMELSTSEQWYYDAWEDMKFRNYDKAHQKLSSLLEADPYHRAALVKMAELEYRRAHYHKALELVNRVLQMDTYDSGANYFAGISYRAIGDPINALESLGWAARDVKYRSAGHGQMAEIYLAMKNHTKAETFAKKALDYNTYNLNARKVLAVIHRKKGDADRFNSQITKILEFDPLNHFAVAEQNFISGEPKLADAVLKNIHNEFVAETILELALEYHHLGLQEEALKVLKIKSDDTKNKLWLAYWQRDSDTSGSKGLLNEVANTSMEFVFPYRRETIPVLEWATQQQQNWKFNYLLAQNYLAVNRDEKGKQLLKDAGNTPDMDTFYRFRAKILKEEGYAYQLRNYEKALQLDNTDWKVWEEFIQFYLNNGKYDEALALTKKATKKFPENYNIGLVHSKALLHTGNYQKVLDVLYNIQLLPYEHARESRQVYEKAHIAIAQDLIQRKKFDKALEVLKKSKEWPENIGVGKPYGPDERPQDYLLAMTHGAMGDSKNQEKYLNEIASYTQNNSDISSPDHVFGLWALKQLGKENELQKLVSTLKENPDNKNQLALALYSKDTQELTGLKNENVVDKTLWKLYENFLKMQ